MVTRKCLAPNSYWIVVNIPGTLTKPRLGHTSAPNQCRRGEKKNSPPSLPFIQQAQHWETECLFEVILYFELLHGNKQAFPLQHREFVLQINEERDFSHLTSFFVTSTTKCLSECKTRNSFSTPFSCSSECMLLIYSLVTWSTSQAWILLLQFNLLYISSDYYLLTYSKT